MPQYIERSKIVEIWKVGRKPIPAWVTTAQNNNNIIFKQTSDRKDYCIVKIPTGKSIIQEGDYIEWINNDTPLETPIFKTWVQAEFDKLYRIGTA